LVESISVATEPFGEVFTIPSFKRLLKRQIPDSRDSQAERERDQSVHRESSERTNQSAIN
jgi:hypothetical protein